MGDLSARILKSWPVGIALIIQLVVFGGIKFIVIHLEPQLFFADQLFPRLLFAGIQGLIAAGISAILPLERWWIIFQALFPGAILVGQTAQLPPSLWLGGFVLLWLIYRNALRERVPLYLSGSEACRAVSELLPSGNFRFIDLGCGTGGLITHLAKMHPLGYFEGIESAPLPWLIARLRIFGKNNCRIRWGDFWKISLGDYDVVYCFLSPAPMEQLWCKVRAELPHGSLLISNSFQINNAPPPSEIVQLSEQIGPLYIWRR